VKGGNQEPHLHKHGNHFDLHDPAKDGAHLHRHGDHYDLHETKKANEYRHNERRHYKELRREPVS